MPYSKSRPRMEAPLEAKDIELYHLGRHRSGAPTHAISRNSSDDAMPRVAVRPALYVTSSPHPFWSTKKGIALSVLVVFALIAGIAGGVLGAKKGKNDTSLRNFGTPSASPIPTSTLSPTPSNLLPPAAAVETETVTETILRRVPRRYLEPPVAGTAPEVTPTALQ